MKRKIIKRIVLSVLGLVFVISAYNVVKILTDYAANDRFYQTLQNKVVTLTPTSNPTDAVPLTVDFDALLKENADVIGWIYAPDTPINYPVVQGKNNEEYLRADLSGDYLYGGTVFADYRSTVTDPDENLMVFGHNLKNNTMFASLTNYKNQSYFDAHPCLYFYTPDATYKIECVYGAIVQANHGIYQLHPTDMALRDVAQNSTFVSPVSLTEKDKLITLSTCSYDYDDARYVVVGKLTKLSK